MVPVADQQQQLAFDFDFDFEPDFDAAENENENEFDAELDGNNFADDPEFYNTGDYPSIRLTLDEIPYDQRRRVARLRPGVIPTIACALSGFVRAAQHAASSVLRPAEPPAPAPEPAPEPVPQPAPAPAPPQTPEDTSLPEPAIVYDGADDTPNITLSQRDFLDLFSALRHAFVGLPGRWRHFLELANEFVTNRCDAPDEPPDLQPQPAA